MSDSMVGLRRKIKSAGDLQSVVRTMKALAASSIGQYEQAVLSLTDYYRAVELGLGLYFKENEPETIMAEGKDQYDTGMIGAIVFGSDQGLVGQFNEVVADYTIKTLSSKVGKPQVWAVGERVQTRLLEAGLPVIELLSVPASISAIAPLVGKIQIKSEAHRLKGKYTQVYVFHNRPLSGSLYEPISQRLLPLDAEWQLGLSKIPWPTKRLPEVMSSNATALSVFIREYLFISLFQACAESLASENASRLAAMERADKNINELLENLNGNFHSLRQRSIDEELFDVVSGYESMTK